MRFGQKILLLTLLITAGTSLTLASVVTLNITRYEKRRCNERTSQAIACYVSHLADEHRRIDQIVQELLEAPAARSQLQAADESASPAPIEQLRQEILGRTVQTELESSEGPVAFHVLVNLAGEVLLTEAPGDAALGKSLQQSNIHWPIERIIESADDQVSTYVTLPSGLFLAMGVPLRTELDSPPTDAYFVGFRVTDEWVGRQLLLQHSQLTPLDAPLAAWFVADEKIIAHASSEGLDPHLAAFKPSDLAARSRRVPDTSAPSQGAAQSVEFDVAGEHYTGQRFDLNANAASPDELVMASSLDRALQPLRELQRQIFIFSVIACIAAVVLCRWLAKRLANPVRELVTGTQRIAGGEFSHPVSMHRRDEFGQIAVALNEMAKGLIERDKLRDHRTKTERDLAVARKIQMDVLPREIPHCPGYDIATYSLPAEQTGGDIFDVVALSDAESPAPLVLLLADATGHGIGAALSVTQVLAMLRIGVRLQSALGRLLTQINRQLCDDLSPERFVTAFLGLLDPRSNTISYYSAGQAPLLHYRAADQSLHWLDASMLPLGILPDDDSPAAESIELAPGDLVVLLTDGFYERQNSAGEQLEKDRVGSVVAAHHAESAQAILNQLLTAAQSFAAGAPQLDDMTAIIIRRCG